MEEKRSVIDDDGGEGAAIKKSKMAAAAIEKENDKVTQFMKRLTNELESGRQDDAHWIKSNNWEYSAPDVYPYEIDENGARFLEDIKRITIEMRKGGESANDGLVRLHNGGRYRDVYRPHWQEFATALKQYERGDALLDLTGIELPHDVRCILWDAMKHNDSFTQFTFSFNNLDEGGIQFVIGLLETNPQIETLECTDNYINNNIADIFSSVVSKHPSLVEINLDGSVYGRPGYDLVCSLVRSGLKKVSVPFCELCSNGSTALSDILATNPKVEELEPGPTIDDNDAIGIASALATNTNLKSLTLIGNNAMTVRGKIALRRAIFDPSSLNSTANSNHTCKVNLDYEKAMNYNGNQVVRQGYSIDNLNRAAKIYNILATRNKAMSNTGHFADIRIELLPDILYAVGIYSKGEPSKRMSSPGKRWKSNSPFQINLDIKPLSIVYEIMRSWDKAFACYEDLGATAAVSLGSQCILI